MNKESNKKELDDIRVALADAHLYVLSCNGVEGTPEYNNAIVERLYKEGVRVVPESSVVLSKEEYNDLNKQIHAFKHLATCYSEQIDWDNDMCKKTAKEIIKEVKAFLDMQTKTVNELSNSNSRYAIPESCRDCYEGSQKNRIAMLQRIAEKYGVEIEE